MSGGRVDHRGIAEQGLPRERRQHLGDDPHRRKDQDVHLRVTEDPEQMLPEQRGAPARGDVERGPEEAVEHQEDQGDRDRREGEEGENVGDEGGPDEERQPEERHPGRPQVEDRHQEVERCEDARRPEEQEAQEPEVRVGPDRERLRSERRVAEPAGVGSRPHEPARIEEEPAEEEDPVRERVEPGEGHVPRADHQRDEVVEECGRQRHEREEHHARAVHGEELVVPLGAEELAVGPGQLEPDQQGLDSRDQEEHERGRAVEETDPLVIDGGEP